MGEGDAIAPAVDQDHPSPAQQRGEARQEGGVARAPDHPRPHHHRLQAVQPVRPAHQLLAGGGHYATLYNTYFRHQSLEYVEQARVIATGGGEK